MVEGRELSWRLRAPHLGIVHAYWSVTRKHQLERIYFGCGMKGRHYGALPPMCEGRRSEEEVRRYTPLMLSIAESRCPP
jgi:hypothetical protein